MDKKDLRKGKYQFVIHNNDKYFPIRYHFEGYPLITGIPYMEWKEFVTNIRRNIMTRKPQISLVATPKECAYRHLINYPIRKWGSFQCSALGTYGYGKSNFLHLTTAFLLALKHRILMFDDSSAEFRNLAAHGYYDKNKKFTPFQITVFVPNGYEFDEKAPNHNPLWNHRNNIHVRTFKQPKEIINALAPHKLTVLYTEAFDPSSLLRLWIELMNILKKMTTINESYIFLMHELADLFPEGATKEMYELIDLAKLIIRRFRRNRIGILTSFHETADVTYKVSRKFGFIAQKRTVNKKDKTQVEEYSKAFSRKQVAISQGGYFREHIIELFPELVDKYRMAPNDNAWYYDKGTGILNTTDLGDIAIKDKKTPSSAQIARLYQCWLDGNSIRTACKEVEVSFHRVREMFDVWNDENLVIDR
ncbi:hypothetical protein LCGC14_1068370 [marine sediment metagenome]|uniref:Uncharacterized protein n=1 Tax=marine sediment metagenome TaxID=412755 RepID=A0A0F9MJ29_9ZZZZ